MGTRKQFDEELFKQNDASAIATVVAHVCADGGFATQNDEKYAPDILVYGTSFRKLSYIETEVKHNWKADQDQFPFPTVNLPERKGKYLRKALPIEYWILRSDLKMAIILPDFVVSSSKLEEVPNKYIKAGELFYKVPVDQCILVSLNSPEGE